MYNYDNIWHYAFIDATTKKFPTITLPQIGVALSQKLTELRLSAKKVFAKDEKEKELPNWQLKGSIVQELVKFPFVIFDKSRLKF